MNIQKFDRTEEINVDEKFIEKLTDEHKKAIEKYLQDNSYELLKNRNIQCNTHHEQYRDTGGYNKGYDE